MHPQHDRTVTFLSVFSLIYKLSSPAKRCSNEPRLDFLPFSLRRFEAFRIISGRRSKREKKADRRATERSTPISGKCLEAGYYTAVVVDTSRNFSREDVPFNKWLRVTEVQGLTV